MLKKYKSLLNSRELSVIYLCLAIAVCLAAVELAFFGLLSPLLAMMLSGDPPSIPAIYREFIGLFTTDIELSLIAFFLALIVAIRAGLQISFQYLHLSIAYSIGERLAGEIFDSIFSIRNTRFDESAERVNSITRDVTIELNEFVGAIIAALNLAIESIVAIALIALIIFTISLEAAAWGGLILPIVWGILIYTRPKLRKLGLIRQRADGSRMSLLSQLYTNIIQVNIHRNINYFKTSFDSLTSASLQAARHHTFIKMAPKVLLDLFLYSMIVGAIYAYSMDTMTTSALSQAGVVLVALMRLMPTVNRILNTSQALRYAESSYNCIERHLTSVESTRQRDLCLVHGSLRLNDLIYQMGDVASSPQNITFKKGAVSAIVGSSGSGKTTLIKTIFGFNDFSGGEIILDETRKLRENEKFQLDAAFVPQFNHLVKGDLYENVLFDQSKDAAKRQQLELISKDLGLDPQLLERSFSGDSGIPEVSGGQLQRIALARALIKEKALLVLDEPTASLDDTNVVKFLRLLKEFTKEKIVIVVTHDDRVKKFCDIVYELDTKK